MRTEEFIEKVSQESKDNARFEELKRGLPLGEDMGGNIVLAQKRLKPIVVRNTCVTGVGKTNFIRRLLITLSCLFDGDEACFFVLSPHTEYGELLRLSGGNFVVPYIRNKDDLALATAGLKELLTIQQNNAGRPRVILVLDGLDTLPDCNANGDLGEYSSFFELCMRNPDVDVICGADLAKSIFAGFPGPFLGMGNCLVTMREPGKADVTYVGNDSSLSLPMPIVYPSEPTVMESIIFLTALPSNE